MRIAPMTQSIASHRPLFSEHLQPHIYWNTPLSLSQVSVNYGPGDAVLVCWRANTVCFLLITALTQNRHPRMFSVYFSDLTLYIKWPQWKLASSAFTPALIWVCLPAESVRRRPFQTWTERLPIPRCDERSRLHKGLVVLHRWCGASLLKQQLLFACSTCFAPANMRWRHASVNSSHVNSNTPCSYFYRLTVHVWTLKHPIWIPNTLQWCNSNWCTWYKKSAKFYQIKLFSLINSPIYLLLKRSSIAKYK